MEKMNPEIKQQWLELLRSGKYTQGTGQLINEITIDTDGEEVDLEIPTYCCLGILCLVKGCPEKPSANEMPEECTLTWAGIPWVYGTDGYGKPAKWIIEGPAKVLADKNDDGETFTDIADYIEANL